MTQNSSLISRAYMLRYQYILIFLALTAYCLPWLLNPGVSLSFGVYDLAEWTSLHSAVRASAPPLLLTFVLRLPLICLVSMVAFRDTQRVFRAIFAIIVTAALMPPLEFFTQYPDDPNYRQQFALALIALVIDGVGLSGIVRRNLHFIRIAGGIVGVVAAVWGLSQAYMLMDSYYLPVWVGPGGVLFIIICAIFAAVEIQTTRQPRPPRRIIQSRVDETPA